MIEGSNCREIIDNVVDMAHFFYVHYSLPDYFKNVFEGETAAQYMNSHGRPDVDIMTAYGDTKLESIAAYYGPAYMLNPMVQYYGGYAIETILTNCHYPIDNNSFVLMYGVIAKIPEGLTAEQADKMATKITAGIEVGFLQDVEIWKHKSRIDNPLLVEEDGPVYQLRRWYEQFYVDVADVTEEMTQRYDTRSTPPRPSRTGISRCRRTSGSRPNAKRRPENRPRRWTRRHDEGALMTLELVQGPGLHRRSGAESRCRGGDHPGQRALSAGRSDRDRVPDLPRPRDGEEVQPPPHERAVDLAGQGQLPRVQGDPRRRREPGDVADVPADVGEHRSRSQ